MKVLWGDVMRIRMYFMQEGMLSGTKNHWQEFKSLGLNWCTAKDAFRHGCSKVGQKNINWIRDAHCFLWNLKDALVPRVSGEGRITSDLAVQAWAHHWRKHSMEQRSLRLRPEAWITQSECLCWSLVASCVNLDRLLIFPVPQFLSYAMKIMIVSVP